MVIVPVGHHVEPQTETGLRELERRGYVVWRIYGYSAIDFARSNLATRALAQGFAETLWIDSDIVFSPDEVDRLRSSVTTEDAERYPKGELPGVITGIYSKKGTREITVEVGDNCPLIIFGEGGSVIRVKYAPGGMLLVRRWVYEEVQSRLRLPLCESTQPCGIIPFFLPMIISEGNAFKYYCEDFAFCHRVRECGIPIWADTRMRLFHIGSYPYGWEDAGKPVERYSTYRFQVVEEPQSNVARIDVRPPPKD